MLQVAVAGIAGRMGQSLVAGIESSNTMQVSLGTEQHASHGESRYAIKPAPLISSDDVFDVMIDFTTPASCLAHLDACLRLARPMVIGTTGLEAKSLEKIQQAAKTIPIVYSPNMSIGVNLVYGLLEQAASRLDESWQVAIAETHHRFKKDAPSGTALEMGRVIEQSSSPTRTCQYQSARLGNVPGEHHVTFATDDECIEITHKACDRMIFARGALKAAKWIVNQPPGLYTMQNVLKT